MRDLATVGQKLLKDCEEKKNSFLRFVKEEIKNYALKSSGTGNMDEVPISFDMPAALQWCFYVYPQGILPLIVLDKKKTSFRE